MEMEIEIEMDMEIIFLEWNLTRMELEWEVGIIFKMEISLLKSTVYYFIVFM